MAVEIKRRRGTSEEHAYFTGAPGEITVDTTKFTAVVHDGVTVGGHPLAKEALVNQYINSEISRLVDDGTIGMGPEGPAGPPGPAGTFEIGEVVQHVELRSTYETLRRVNSAIGTVNIDLADGSVHELKLTGAVALNLVQNEYVPDNKAVGLTLILTMGGMVTSVTWPSSVKWPQGLLPSMPEPGKSYVFSLLTTNGGASWIGLTVGERIDY